jgi:hypothetical protein
LPLIDINGDGLPDRVFDHNPEADDQLGFFVYLNTGDGFDNGKQKTWLIVTWISVKHSIG